MYFVTLAGETLNCAEIDSTTTFAQLQRTFSREPFEKVRFILDNGQEIENYNLVVKDIVGNATDVVSVIFGGLEIIERVPFVNDKEVVTYIERPERYGRVPSICQSTLGDTTTLKVMTHESQVQYLNTYFGPKSFLKLATINGCDLTFQDFCYYCSLCKKRIQSAQRFQRCSDCKTELCASCIPLFYDCSTEGHDVEERVFQKQLIATCKTCEKDILDKNYYSLSSGGDNVCRVCFEQTTSAVQEKAVSKSTFCTSLNCSFGSLLDWVPIVEENSERFILYNANPDSPYYTRIGACVADDRKEYHYAMFGSSETIDSILGQVLNETKFDTQWRNNVNSPIFRLMETHGIDVELDSIFRTINEFSNCVEQ